MLAENQPYDDAGFSKTALGKKLELSEMSNQMLVSFCK